LSAKKLIPKEKMIATAAGGAHKQNDATRVNPKLLRRITGRKNKKLYRPQDPPM
jgi:hypothetical protein